MSSSTSYRAAPARPEPPPQVTSTGAGHMATSVCGILGTTGCKLIQKTLTDLARGSSSALLKELAEGQSANAVDLRGWEVDPRDPTRFTRKVDGVDVVVLTGGAALETQFQFNVTSTRALTPAELQARAGAIQKQANRVINKVLAVALVKEQIEPKIREKQKEQEKLKLKLKEKIKVSQPIKVRNTNVATVQLTCVTPINR